MMAIQYDDNGEIIATVIGETPPVCDNQLILSQPADLDGMIVEMDEITGEATGEIVLGPPDDPQPMPIPLPIPLPVPGEIEEPIGGDIEPPL
jgi:hypothetical protein